MRIKGKCKWFSPSKGFGFLVSDEIDKDIFVHFSSLEMEGFKTLKENSEVEFELVDSDRGPQAAHVTIIDE